MITIYTFKIKEANSTSTKQENHHKTCHEGDSTPFPYSSISVHRDSGN